MELKEILPRLEAWDAENADDGWAIDVKDLHNWAKENIAECANLDTEEIAQYLTMALKNLIKYTDYLNERIGINKEANARAKLP